jgi:dTDP-4-dehydrorhamnose 3,5-epimerase
MFDTVNSSIPGMVELKPRVHTDPRGRLVKVFHQGAFRELGFMDRFDEAFYSVSSRDVLRGLHFQTPPHEHAKLVTCVTGSVWDVALDLRDGSPTYRRHFSVTLSSKMGNVVYLPAGVAHGFCVLEAPAVVLYFDSSVHAPKFDAGVRWDSAGIQWPIDNPEVSTRDRLLPQLEEFASPFIYESN